MCRHVRVGVALVLAGLVSSVGEGVAQPDHSSEEPLVTPVQGTEAYIAITTGLSSGAVLEPLTVAPDVFFGATDGLAVGVTHSAKAQTGFTTAASSGLCATGSSGGCDQLYSGLGFAARFRVVAGNLQLAADTGLVGVSLYDPFALSLKAGALARAHLGRLTLWTNPNVWVGLTARTHDAMALNRERVHVPVRASVRLLLLFDVGVEAGVRGPVRDFADLFEIPVAAIATIDVSRTVHIGFLFGFDNLAGRDGGFSDRSLSLFATSAL